jgi:hypothetical protein
MMDLWFPSIVYWLNGNKYNVNDEPLNNFFEENGYKSKLFINNIGSALMYFLIYLFIWIITLIFILIGKWIKM